MRSAWRTDLNFVFSLTGIRFFTWLGSPGSSPPTIISHFELNKFIILKSGLYYILNPSFMILAPLEMLLQYIQPFMSLSSRNIYRGRILRHPNIISIFIFNYYFLFEMRPLFKNKPNQITKVVFNLFYIPFP